MLLKLAALSSILVLASARTQLTNCLDDNKYCVGLPRGCLGPKCIVAFSSISNGTHTEIEIFGSDILDKTWLGIAYSADTEMKDDFVVFCIRDDKRPEDDWKKMAGLAFNTDHLNEMIGTIEQIEMSPKKDKFKLDLDILEYEKGDKTLYCKLTHRVNPITEHFNMTKVEILAAKGVWIKDAVTYHGRTRNNVGQVDLSGKKKAAKKSAAGSLALLSSAVTFIVAKILHF
ncbi:unnamed protein product [Caenorhabditis sp. 36 PRJEB53466]|nr:unnamed protein product [Caenorhabditis sp. 36 PRJEB53466]